ncbi:MAG: Imm45 family immunity protein [Aquamicrobium sp.]|uniref:Imm45 family immunity protein n=1 Tax=Aquamicrobium sp. TaxID=1872579 RepID=UPI00349ED60B|nr:Imm45 family immunity protein [Aquamicrobium sp.]
MLKWQRTVEQREEWRLLDRPTESLWRGDILRLAHNPGLGPNSPPLDLMLFEMWAYDDRLGLMILDGYKAGMPMLYFPRESQGQGKMSLETSWLIAHWDQWICYFDHMDEADSPVPLPIEETVVIRRPQHMPDLNI